MGRVSMSRLGPPPEGILPPRIRGEAHVLVAVHAVFRVRCVGRREGGRAARLLARTPGGVPDVRPARGARGARGRSPWLPGYAAGEVRGVVGGPSRPRPGLRRTPTGRCAGSRVSGR